MPETLPTLLVTGFEPFGGDSVNPSELVAAALHGSVVEAGRRRARVVAQRLPCAFADARRRLVAAVDEWRPLAVLSLGLAAGRAGLTPERVAINLADARIADNAGGQPADQPVLPQGPAAYFTTLPVKAMVAAMRAAGAPAELSLSAGSFVCNELFYGLMHHLATAGPAACRGGFMHLPLLPAQAAGPAGLRPSVALDLQVAATAAALQAVLAHEHDIAAAGGTIA
ncbi:MAG: pyroglutamyl-peptidase I [Burkholderiaceae bacterium]|nr:pyroglutamyl-peptidase I [Burkholderiaceae bacterium]